MRKVIVVGRGNAVVRVIYDATQKKSSITDFEGAVPLGTQSEVRINTLACIVHTMKQLKEKGISDETTPTIFLVPGVVADPINNGTALFWVKGGGKLSSGQPLNETEMDLWNQFYALYKDMVTDVAFKDVQTARIPERPRYPVTAEQRIEADYVSKAWDRCQPTAPQLEEGDVAF